MSIDESHRHLSDALLEARAERDAFAAENAELREALGGALNFVSGSLPRAESLLSRPSPDPVRAAWVVYARAAGQALGLLLADNGAMTVAEWVAAGRPGRDAADPYEKVLAAYFSAREAYERAKETK